MATRTLHTAKEAAPGQAFCQFAVGLHCVTLPMEEINPGGVADAALSNIN